MVSIPRQGEFYRHFKNRMYQVLAVATHSETGERMVVYQALYGDYGVYVRPLSMFMEPVDREKYPEAVQQDRFEKVIPGSAAGGLPIQSSVEDETQICADAAKDEASQPVETPLNPLFMDFLDAVTGEEKIELLKRMKGKVSQQELDSLYLCLDAKPSGGAIEEQLDNLIQNLNMQQRFDASRLRRS